MKWLNMPVICTTIMAFIKSFTNIQLLLIVSQKHLIEDIAIKIFRREVKAFKTLKIHYISGYNNEQTA